MSAVETEPVDEPRSRPGTPVWEIARLYPAQGHWSEESYLALHTNQLVEFSHGTLEFLEVTTYNHQVIVIFLYELLQAFVRPLKDGRALVAPLRIRVAPGVIREPDVVYLTQQRIPEDGTTPPDGADLVMEVVSLSDESRNRDLVLKRRDYAIAGIPEYWIVDPESATVTILILDGDRYTEAGIYGLGERAVSLRLPGFQVDVTEVLTADKPFPTDH